MTVTDGPAMPDGTRGAAHPEDQVLHLERTQVLVTDGGDDFPFQHMGIGHQLLDVVHLHWMLQPAVVVPTLVTVLLWHGHASSPASPEASGQPDFRIPGAGFTGSGSPRAAEEGRRQSRSA